MIVFHDRQPLDALGTWFCMAMLIIAMATVTGQLSPVLVPDSPSYLEYPFGSLDAMLRSIRTPGYPVLLWVVGKTLGHGAVPLVQVLIHATASWMLMRELRAWGAATISRWAAGIAIAIGCTSLDNAAIISTDLLGASLGVMTAVSLLAWVRTNRCLLPALGTVVFSLAAISVRPAYLALIPWVLIAGGLLWIYRFRTSTNVPLGRSILLTCLLCMGTAVPVVAWSALRGIVVDDFGILPFGHQNLSGLTVQFVDDEELLEVANQSEALAREIIASKQRYLEAGYRLPPGNARATMTIESRWDEYVWRIVVPAARVIHADDAIASHRGIAMMNREIISAYPWRYARWLLLAARRACWGTAANIVMHPVFLAAIGCAVLIKLMQVLRLLSPRIGALASAEASTPPSQVGIDVLFILASTYFALHVALVILTSPPIGRFADAAAIFIPAWSAAWMTQTARLPKGSLRVLWEHFGLATKA